MPNWMTDVRAATFGSASPFGNRPLNQITIPGTHDAGCYTTHTPGTFDTAARTQSHNIAQQLAGGIRYFDLRPKKNGLEFWTYHGPYTGGRLDGGVGILQDVANFMTLGPGVAAGQELVVLNFSHFKSFTGSDHHRLIEEIRARLGAFLVQHNQNAFNLFGSPYNNVLSPPGVLLPASRVAVLYDGALDTPLESLCPTLPDGFFKLNPKYDAGPNAIFLFDQYANRDTLIPTQNDQMDKLLHRGNYPFSTQPWAAGPPPAGNWTNNGPYPAPGTGIQNTWHLFSWTLTPQNLGNFFNPSQTVSPLLAAQNNANPFLEAWFTGNHWPIGVAARGYDPTQDQRINVIYVDNYASQAHNCLIVGGPCPRAGYAAPVALCDFINRNFIAGAWPGWAGNY
jgi:hypothetical protein